MKGQIDMLRPKSAIDRFGGKDYVMMWTPPAKCFPDRCKLVDDCGYDKQNPVDPTRPGFCLVEKKYLTNIVKMLLNPKKDMGVELTQFQVERIGYHIMPLYQILIRLKMEAYTGKTVTYSPHGIKMNPVFKEIRETMRDIDRELKELDLPASWVSNARPKNVVDPYETGDPDLHDRLSKTGD